MQLRRIIAAMLLIEGDIALDDVLRRVVDEAASITGARYGALGVVSSDRSTLSQFITTGMTKGEETEIGTRPKGLGVLGLLIADPRPLRISELNSHPQTVGFPPGHPPMTSFLGVPIMIRGEVYGNLYLTDKIGAAEFSDDDLELAEALAVAAGIVIENVRLHSLLQIAAVHEDRERLARDLHDRVIQRVFGAGLMLQGIPRGAPSDELAKRHAAVIEQLDEGIREIRSSIFELGFGGHEGGIRAQLTGLVSQLNAVYDCETTLYFDGPVDTAISVNVSDHIMAIVRESATNIGKHAEASRAEIHLTVQGGLCGLRIVDDGKGLPPDWSTTGGRGLLNIESRAQSLDGTLSMTSSPSNGTVLDWRVPVS